AASHAAGTDHIGASYGGSTVHSTRTATPFNLGVTTHADLSISKVDSPDPVLAGNLLTYTLTVHNGGPSDAQAVSVSDVLPGALTGGRYTVGGGPSSSWSGSAGLGTVAAGVTKTVVITA